MIWLIWLIWLGRTIDQVWCRVGVLSIVSRWLIVDRKVCGVVLGVRAKRNVTRPSCDRSGRVGSRHDVMSCDVMSCDPWPIVNVNRINRCLVSALPAVSVCLCPVLCCGIIDQVRERPLGGVCSTCVRRKCFNCFRFILWVSKPGQCAVRAGRWDLGWVYFYCGR